MAQTSGPRLHYAWVMAALVFTVLLVGGGVRSTPGVLITALEREFGWSRALLSGAVSLNIVLYGIGGPFAAAVMDTVGMRRCVLAALVLMIVGVLCTVAMTAAWHMYLLWGVLVGASCGVIAPVLGKVVVNRWFDKHAGLVMGVFAASAQTGQVAFSPLLGWMVLSVGWRWAAATMALAAASMLLPVMVLLRERPADVGCTPLGQLPAPASAAPADADDGEPSPDEGSGDANDAPTVSAVDKDWAAIMVISKEDKAAHESAGVAVTEVEVQPLTGSAPTNVTSVPTAQQESPFRRPLTVLRNVSVRQDFWLLAGSFFVCGASTNGLIATHLIPACVDIGMTEVLAASLLAVIGVFDIVGTLVSGALSDRFDNRVLLAIYYAFRGLALVFLPWALDFNRDGALWPFAVVYGLDWIATVPPTAGLCSSCFGKERSAIVFAWCLTAHQVGAASVAAIAGVLRTEFGSYQSAFWGSGVLCVLTALAVLRIERGTAIRWRKVEL